MSISNGRRPARGKKRQATITDVAATAGVSIGTVSRYLNGYQVRRDNREEIEKAIESHGYARSAVASAMKTDTLHMVGLMVPNCDEFHAGLLASLVTLLRIEGLATLTYCHGNNQASVEDAFNVFRTHRVDALIMTGFDQASNRISEVVGGGTPVVLYDNELRGLNVDCVKVENFESSRRAVRHLAELGHERVAVITGNLSHWTAQQRLRGYQAALEEAGLQADPGLVFQGYWTKHDGYAAMGRAWEADKRPTAVFSCSARMTFGALTFLKDQGARVPNDISLVSFDDVEMFELFDPTITAVAQPVHRIAESIKDLVVSRLNQEEFHSRLVNLPCEIILRNSTRRLQS